MNTEQTESSFFNFLNGKTVLITGNTGFKGAWLSELARAYGAKVVGLSLGVPTMPSLFESLGHRESIKTHWGDVSDAQFVSQVISESQPDLIFHLAAQPIVGLSISEPVLTWRSNALGTATLLESVAKTGKDGTVVVCVTSDKVYRNREWNWGYRENDELGGTDPYSASKAAASLAIRSFVDSQHVSSRHILVSEVRAGNVIGGGDWAVGRIVPDAVRAWLNNEPLVLRNPDSTRPWQHVLEPLCGYLFVARALIDGKIASGEAFNFGPNESRQTSVLNLITRLRLTLEKLHSLHLKVQPSAGVESKLLKLDSSKALEMLGWAPTLSVEESIDWTAGWYLSMREGADLNQLTRQQVSSYVSRLTNGSIEGLRGDINVSTY